MQLAVNVRQEENGKCIAWCEALPGCTARGDDQQQAIAKIEQAIQGYLASLNVAAPVRVVRA